jgi:hypothetical protein
MIYHANQLLASLVYAASSVLAFDWAMYATGKMMRSGVKSIEDVVDV